MYCSRLRKFWRLSLSTKFALFEAAIFLALAQFLTKRVPYSLWSTSLGPINPAHHDGRSPFESETLQTVIWVVHSMARYLPWTAVCLPRAMVAKWMLARRKIPSTLILGVRRPLTAQSKESQLHACLSVGNRMVTGGDVADQFKVIARFGD